MLELIPIIPLLLATLEDLKKKEVSDTLNYIMLNITVFLFIINIIKKFSIEVLINLAISICILYVLSYLFIKFRIWGGGDLKIMLWLAFFLSKNLFDPVIFLLILFSIGFIINFLYCLYIFAKKSNFGNIIKTIKSKAAWIAVLNLCTIPLIFLNFYIFLILIIFLNFVFIVVSSVEEYFIIERDVDALVEGDWLAEDIVVNGKIIISKEKPYLTKEDIRLLKKLKDDGKINKVKIKEGVPFVPSILIAYLIFLIVKTAKILETTFLL